MSVHNLWSFAIYATFAVKIKKGILKIPKHMIQNRICIFMTKNVGVAVNLKLALYLSLLVILVCL